MRSAVYQEASQTERQPIHAALAVVLDGQPDWQVLAQCGGRRGPDERVAADLGAPHGAKQGGAPHPRSARFAWRPSSARHPPAGAAGSSARRPCAFLAGQVAVTADPLTSAESLDLSSADRTWMSYLHETYSQSGWSGVAKVGVIAEAISAAHDTSARAPLLNVGLHCWWATPIMRPAAL